MCSYQQRRNSNQLNIKARIVQPQNMSNFNQEKQSTTIEQLIRARKKLGLISSMNLILRVFKRYQISMKASMAGRYLLELLTSNIETLLARQENPPKSSLFN